MKEDLIREIKKLRKDSKYDCLLMFSGGKDSSYLLYFLSQELGLDVATITLSHRFLDEKTLQNIESFSKRFSKRHFVIENEYLNKAGKHFLESWINRPEEGSLITLCTGCRLGLIKIIIETAKGENINTVITGLTPFEKTDFRLKKVNYPPGSEGKFNFFLGYLRLIFRNPLLISNLKVFNYQLQEYYYFSNQKKIYKQNNLTLLLPFYHFLAYDESVIIDTLKKLGWQKSSVSSNSYWRADCNMNAVRQFFHAKISGYNELEKYYGRMLDQGLITEEYYYKNVKDHYKTEDILKIIESSEISNTAIIKYRKFLMQ